MVSHFYRQIICPTLVARQQAYDVPSAHIHDYYGRVYGLVGSQTPECPDSYPSWPYEDYVPETRENAAGDIQQAIESCAGKPGVYVCVQKYKSVLQDRAKSFNQGRSLVR